MSSSALEAELYRQLTLGGMDVGLHTEYRFDDSRKWRFDFAYPDRMIAVEVEGGEWVNGRHSRGSGMTNDCEKYNRAAQLGWRVFRFTGGMVKDGRAFAMLNDVVIPF